MSCLHHCSSHEDTAGSVQVSETVTSVNQIFWFKDKPQLETAPSLLFLLFLGSSLVFEQLMPALFYLQTLVDANNKLRFSNSSITHSAEDVLQVPRLQSS